VPTALAPSLATQPLTLLTTVFLCHNKPLQYNSPSFYYYLSPTWHQLPFTATINRLLGTSNHLPLPFTAYLAPATIYRYHLPPTWHQQPFTATIYRLLGTSYHLPPTWHQRPFTATIYRLFGTSYHLPPTWHQLPITAYLAPAPLLQFFCTF